MALQHSAACRSLAKHTCNGNNIGGNVCGHITTLSFNDWEGSKGATAELLIHLGSTLEQTGMEVEHLEDATSTRRLIA